jgi:lipid-A-disaccharide synthase
MKYYIIAGEASGDLHGSNLIKEIRKLDPAADIRCWGGDLMQSAGATLVKHYRDLAFMGFVEVVRHLGTILRNMSFCKKDIMAFHPDVMIFIDYPGFNIPIAEFAKSKGYRTVYYISPQVWAWKEGRVKTIRRVIDKMLVILPFEKDFYRKWNYAVDYVGHPLIEVTEPYRMTGDGLRMADDGLRMTDDGLRMTDDGLRMTDDGLRISGLRKADEMHLGGGQENVGATHDTGDAQSDNPQSDNPLMPIAPSRNRYIALLPGSRKQEVSAKLPVMLAVSKHFPQYKFVVAQAPSLEDDFIRSFTRDYPDVETRKGATYPLLQASAAALVTSGTATLETALIGVPEVVCYKGSPISYAIAKRVIRVKYISLVNLIMDREVVKELIQHDLTVDNLVTALHEILENSGKQEQLRKDYAVLWEKLSAGGHASSQAAKIIVEMLHG